MKLELKADERGGSTAVITGCGVGGHRVRFLFQSPEYGPVEFDFDGDEVSYARPGLHAAVIGSILDSEDFWDRRASIEAFSPDTETPKRRSTRKDETPAPEPKPTKGAVTADED